jgi:eukaryotic-like serine/threonine-protein kinase
MPVRPGTRLGHYDILEKVGEGGMGAVYRARDTKLERDVAVKVLPDLFAGDPERVARLEREAKSVAQLSHPNILNIFDFGRDPSSGAAYAVMELLDGETLRERLAGGPLAPRKAVDYGVQIARGLAAAHARGIVHRDLKPDNLFVTRDDRVKILDFGLARPLELGSADVTGRVATAVGLVMGTVGYMAPEQVRAQAMDHRADLFALGAVLYEMLSGRRAFGGDSPADTMSAILHQDPPDIETTGVVLPPALDRIVRRCLEKKPELRFQSAEDLAFALETLSARTSGAAVTPGDAARRRRTPATLPWALAALATLAALALGAAALRAPAPEIPWQHFTAITDMAGVETAPSLSPDGTTVAYATRAAGNWDIYGQRVGGRTPVPLAADPERQESGPAFSPDGRSIAYHDGRGAGAIFVATAAGEAARRLTDFGMHPAWSPDSRHIAFTTEEITTPYSRLGESTLWIVDAAGGTPRPVEGAGDAAQPSWSPAGARIAYWTARGGQRDIYTVPAAGGEAVAVTDEAALDWAPAWAPDGRHIYFASDRGGSMNIWRIAVDERTGAPRGAPEPVTTGVQAAADLPAFSRDGSRLVFRSTVTAVNPVAIPFDPVTLRAGTPVVLQNSNTIRTPTDVSRDGRWLSFGNIGEPQEDIFISAADGSGLRRLTDDAPRNRMPMWSADGRSIFFYSNRGGTFEIWSMGVDGGGLRRVVAAGAGARLYPLVSPEGDRLVVSAGAGESGVFLVRLGPAGDEDAELLPGSAGDPAFLATSWSPDGTALAGYVVSSSGAIQSLATYDLAGRRIARRFDVPGRFTRWLPDSRRLLAFTAAGDALMVFDAGTGTARRVDVTLPLPDTGVTLALSPDGRTIYYGGRREEADIWILERLKDEG